MNKAYNIEYEEAPCGNVTFYNYKEPLMKFKGHEFHGEGHGFVGALVFDSQSDKVQCHFCGQWFDALGNHINREHALSADMYKRIVGLNKKTALINESFRAKLIANGLEKRIRHLKPFASKRKGRVVSQEVREKIRQTRMENRDETKNIHGTCPEQLIQRLVDLYRKLGRMPKHKEIGFREALTRTYGSMEEACRIAGVPYRPPGVNTDYSSRTKYTEDSCILWVRDFFDEHGRLPQFKDPKKKQIWYKINKFGRRKIFRLALAMDGRYRKSDRIRYSKEELINFLRTFEKINGRRPSYSDCKRGLLPNLSRYTYNFGSWKGALKVAFNES